MTAIVISCNGQTLLTQLCLDAIAKFTSEPHVKVLVFTHSRWTRSACPNVSLGGVFTVMFRDPVWPWYSSAKKYAGTALADAFQAARESLGTSVDRIMFMHNDSLPVRSGWLSYLHSKLSPYHHGTPFADTPNRTYMVGVKASERNGAPHSSGVLFDARWLATLPATALAEQMPQWDVAEWPASMTRTWSADAWCHRPSQGSKVFDDWWSSFDCDVSIDGRDVFYVHRGGGSWLGGIDIEKWVKAAREGLGL
jgi:hypothetical protein